MPGHYAGVAETGRSTKKTKSHDTVHFQEPLFLVFDLNDPFVGGLIWFQPFNPSTLGLAPADGSEFIKVCSQLLLEISINLQMECSGVWRVDAQRWFLLSQKHLENHRENAPSHQHARQTTLTSFAHVLRKKSSKNDSVFERPTPKNVTSSSCFLSSGVSLIGSCQSFELQANHVKTIRNALRIIERHPTGRLKFKSVESVCSGIMVMMMLLMNHLFSRLHGLNQGREAWSITFAWPLPQSPSLSLCLSLCLDPFPCLCQ